MKKKAFLSFFFLLCFTLASCSSTEVKPSPTKDTDEINGEQSVSWSSYLSSIQEEDIGYPGWPMGQEKLTNDELAQLLRNTAPRQTDSSEEAFGNIIWTLSMYVDAPPDDKLNQENELRLSAGLQENLVCIWGGNAFPNGKFYVEDNELYWIVRSINDTDSSIDEVVLSTYQNVIEQYIAEEQSHIENSAITVELLSVKEQIDINDIGVKVYTIGTVWTSDSPEELFKCMAGGGYIDSELRLHPDGNSSKPNLLVIDGTAMGYLSWGCLEETNMLQDFNSSEELLNGIQDVKQWFSLI